MNNLSPETSPFKSLNAQIHNTKLCSECIFDLVVVGLCVESVVEVAGFYMSERRLWTIFLSITLATPLLFLLLVIAVWETGHALKASKMDAKHWRHLIQELKGTIPLRHSFFMFLTHLRPLFIC